MYIFTKNFRLVVEDLFVTLYLEHIGMNRVMKGQSCYKGTIGLKHTSPYYIIGVLQLAIICLMVYIPVGNFSHVG